MEDGGISEYHGAQNGGRVLSRKVKKEMLCARVAIESPTGTNSTYGNWERCKEKKVSSQGSALQSRERYYSFQMDRNGAG